MPLPRLQQVGADEDRFIYDIAWTREIRRAQFEDDMRFDNAIRFVEEELTAEHLIRLNPLVRPIVEAAWTRSVAAWNRDVAPEMELEEFLFGRDRISTLLVRGPLAELQQGRCFYCGDSLRGDPEVDHFLPWARYPTDALENLVVTHRSCNGHKSDPLAALDHVLRWREFGERHEKALDQIAVEVEWDRRPERTLGVARALYLRQPPGMKLWHLGTRFVELRSDDVRRALLAQ
ncbi:MAG: HNH endonuclease [Stellaceae bacterium]